MDLSVLTSALLFQAILSNIRSLALTKPERTGITLTIVSKLSILGVLDLMSSFSYAIL